MSDKKIITDIWGDTYTVIFENEFVKILANEFMVYFTHRIEEEEIQAGYEIITFNETLVIDDETIEGEFHYVVDISPSTGSMVQYGKAAEEILSQHTT